MGQWKERGLLAGSGKVGERFIEKGSSKCQRPMEETMWHKARATPPNPRVFLG